MLRNFYDKVRDIAEQHYNGKRSNPSDAAVVDRKWESFPFTNSKSVYAWDKF